MRNWKFGVSSTDEAPESAPLLLKGNIVDNLQKAGELGYDAIEVHTREDIELDYNEILNRMKETKVRIAQIVTGRLNTEAMCSLMDDRPYVTEAAMKGMYQYIDMASALEADIVVGWVKGNVPVGKAPEKSHHRMKSDSRPIMTAPSTGNLPARYDKCCAHRCGPERKSICRYFLPGYKWP